MQLTYSSDEEIKQISKKKKMTNQPQPQITNYFQKK